MPSLNLALRARIHVSAESSPVLTTVMGTRALAETAAEALDGVSDMIYTYCAAKSSLCTCNMLADKHEWIQLHH